MIRVLAISLASLSIAALLNPKDQPDTAPRGIAAAAPKADGPSDILRFKLQAGGRSGNCAVITGAQVEPGLHEVDFTRGCAEMLPELAGVVHWVDREDGSVVFAKADGSPVFEFGVSDGVAFESFRPKLPLVSMTEGR